MLPLCPTDLTHLIQMEVPIQPAAALMEEEEIHEREKRSLENPWKNNDIQQIDAQCGDSLCLNGGVCVLEKGRASCRYICL